MEGGGLSACTGFEKGKIIKSWKKLWAVLEDIFLVARGQEIRLGLVERADIAEKKEKFQYGPIKGRKDLPGLIPFLRIGEMINS